MDEMWSKQIGEVAKYDPLSLVAEIERSPALRYVVAQIAKLQGVTTAALIDIAETEARALSAPKVAVTDPVATK